MRILKTMNNQIYRVGITWYVRLANTACWFNGRAIRNDRAFSTRREARRFVNAN